MFIRNSLIINNYVSKTLKVFAKNSFLVGLGTILGLFNVSIATKTLGLTEYGNFINFNIMAQLATGFSVLGLSELSVKYFHTNYGLKNNLNFVFIAFFQIVVSIFMLVFICLFTNTSLVLFIPFYFSLLLVRFTGIFLRAEDSVSLSNFVHSIYFNLIILLTLLSYPALDHEILLNSFSIITITVFILLIPSFYKKYSENLYVNLL